MRPSLFLRGWSLPVSVFILVLLGIWAGSSMFYAALFFGALFSAISVAFRAFFPGNADERTNVLPGVLMFGVAIFARLRLDEWAFERSIQTSLFVTALLVLLLFLKGLLRAESSPS